MIFPFQKESDLMKDEMTLFYISTSDVKFLRYFIAGTVPGHVAMKSPASSILVSVTDTPAQGLWLLCAVLPSTQVQGGA